jgi:hypothetical protein
MRLLIAGLSVSLLAGCVSQTSSVSRQQQTLPDHGYSARVYTSAPAAALAFDPPAIAGMPRLDLSREDRGPAAFVGFEDSSTTYFYLRTDDWYSDNSNGGVGNGIGGNGTRDNYQRRAVTETFGVTHH